MDLFDTRLRASTAVGVVLVVCRRLHMPRVEVAKFTVQRALFALPDASKLQSFRWGSPSTDNCRSDLQRPTESDHICKYEQKLQTELLRPLEICRGKRRRSDGRQLSHELANTTVTTTAHPPPSAMSTARSVRSLFSFHPGEPRRQGTSGKARTGTLSPPGVCNKKDTIVCVPPAAPGRQRWAKVCCASRYLRPPDRVATGNRGSTAGSRPACVVRGRTRTTSYHANSGDVYHLGIGVRDRGVFSFLALAFAPSSPVHLADGWDISWTLLPPGMSRHVVLFIYVVS